MDKARFESYVRAFNSKNLDALRGFYHPEVELVLPVGVTRGPDKIIDRYTEIFRYIDETLEVGFLAIDGNRIAVEYLTEFRCHTDYPDFVEMPLKAGDALVYDSFVFYETEDGMFRRIRASLFTQDSSHVRDI